MAKIIAVVVAALVAAGVAGTTDMVKQAMRDAYGSAKKAFRRKRTPAQAAEQVSPTPAAANRVESAKDIGALIIGDNTKNKIKIDRRK